MYNVVDYTQFCVSGIMVGFALSLIMWSFGLVPRAFRVFTNGR